MKAREIIGFYFKGITGLVLVSVKAKIRTLKPLRSQVNLIKSRKREHSRKLDELYKIIERCSPGPYLELFARGKREGWTVWGNQADNYESTWPTYSYNSSYENKYEKKYSQLPLLDNM